MATFNEIRKELKKLINQKQLNCKTEKEKNKALNEARQKINLKYGKDWRNSDPQTQKELSSFPSIYDGHENGEYWMD